MLILIYLIYEIRYLLIQIKESLYFKAKLKNINDSFMGLSQSRFNHWNGRWFNICE